MSCTDRGSATPLVIGMTACLLLLGVGVIAAGSAALSQSNIQHACDSAAGYLAARSVPNGAEADLSGQASDFLATRYPGATARAQLASDAVLARCTIQAPIIFGALFGEAVSEFSATSVVQIISR